MSSPSVMTARPACCRRPMSAISVTEVSGAELALHSCTACGRHQWQRDGEALDRASLLGAVRERIAQGPSARTAPTRNAPVRRSAAAQSAARADLTRRLAGFTVHGS